MSNDYTLVPEHPLAQVPTEALAAARQAYKEAFLDCSAQDPDMIEPVADAVLAAALPHLRVKPDHWAELIQGLTILARHPEDMNNPTWCEHDALHVCADSEQFSTEEIAELDELGFHVDDEGGFFSYRFGSA